MLYFSARKTRSTGSSGGDAASSAVMACARAAGKERCEAVERRRTRLRTESYCGLDALCVRKKDGKSVQVSRTIDHSSLVGYAPVVEEVEEALELARGDVGEDDRGAVGLACAVNELALEEVLEVRRVALQEVPVDPEQRVLDL